MTTLSSDETTTLIRRALDEDVPAGDVTSDSVVPAEVDAVATFIAKANGVICGTAVAERVFDEVSRRAGESGAACNFEVSWKLGDGDAVSPGDVIGVVTGPARSLLMGERVAINLLSHLSGVATMTRRMVDAAAPAQVLCTRKTIPGLRALERQAVVAGGGVLHRASLSDAVLIKDNHLALVGGSISEAVSSARLTGLAVEVECDTLEQVRQALDAGADRILLDNPTPVSVATAIEMTGDASRLEISGGVTVENVGALVEAGARLVSSGALTHSAPALDISLEVTPA